MLNQLVECHGGDGAAAVERFVVWVTVGGIYSPCLVEEYFRRLHRLWYPYHNETVLGFYPNATGSLVVLGERRESRGCQRKVV